MAGMDAATGAALDGADHVRQSVRDVLNTPIGSRVMRRSYGSRLLDLVDRPLNQATLIEVYAAVADALAAWEPRVRLIRTRATAVEPGRVRLDLDLERVPDPGEPVGARLSAVVTL